MKKMIIGEDIVKSFGEGGEQHNVLDGVSACIRGRVRSCYGTIRLGQIHANVCTERDGWREWRKSRFEGKDLSTLGRMSLQIYAEPKWVLCSNSRRC